MSQVDKKLLVEEKVEMLKAIGNHPEYLMLSAQVAKKYYDELRTAGFLPEQAISALGSIDLKIKKEV